VTSAPSPYREIIIIIIIIIIVIVVVVVVVVIVAVVVVVIIFKRMPESQPNCDGKDTLLNPHLNITKSVGTLPTLIVMLPTLIVMLPILSGLIRHAYFRKSNVKVFLCIMFNCIY